MSDSPDLTPPVQRRTHIPRVEAAPLEQNIPEQAPSKSFAPYMQGEESTAAIPNQKAPSPMELAAQMRSGEEVNLQTLSDRFSSLNSKIDTLNQSVTPQRFGEMTDAEKGFLLTQHDLFQQNVQGLSTQFGRTYTPPKPGGLLADAKTFIDWLTKGQQQIKNVANDLATQTKGKISVVQMMRAQAKLLAAERAVSFASAVVSKGADFVTKMMQTQL